METYTCFLLLFSQIGIIVYEGDLHNTHLGPTYILQNYNDEVNNIKNTIYLTLLIISAIMWKVSTISYIKPMTAIISGAHFHHTNGLRFFGTTMYCRYLYAYKHRGSFVIYYFTAR